MTPNRGNTILFRSSQQLPRPSSLSRTLEGLFELTRLPSRAVDLPRVLLPELQRNKDTTVRCAAQGAKVPGHHQLMKTLIVRFLRTHLFLLFQKFVGPRLPCQQEILIQQRHFVSINGIKFVQVNLMLLARKKRRVPRKV